MAAIQDLRDHGIMHTVNIPMTACHFQALHEVCAATPCNTAFMNITHLLEPHEKALIDQTRVANSSVYMTKTPDCLLFSGENRRFLSVMHSASLYKDEDDTSPPADATLTCQVGVPGQRPPLPFHITLEHSTNGPNCICRTSPFQHIVAQISSVKKLDGVPSELFSSDTLGSLSGRVVSGPDATLLKRAFLGLHDHFERSSEDGSGIYDRSLTLLPGLCKLLMLKNPEGDIHLDRVVDGIAGYRERKSDNGKTLIFVANSNDFHNVSPSSTSDAKVQIFKLDYNGKGKKKTVSQRISYVAHTDDLHSLSNQARQVGVVHSGMTVQEILNHLEFAFRKKELERIGCHFFPQYIECLDQYEKQKKDTQSQ